jgi:hypothetical protein
LNKSWTERRHNQSGASTVQLLCYALSGWLVLTVLLRLTPIYLEHRVIVSVLETIVQEYDPVDDTSLQLRKKLNNAWSLNSIHQVDASEVNIRRRRAQLTLQLEYRVDFPLVGGVSGVWSFEESLTTP